MENKKRNLANKDETEEKKWKVKQLKIKLDVNRRFEDDDNKQR